MYSMYECSRRVGKHVEEIRYRKGNSQSEVFIEEAKSKQNHSKSRSGHGYNVRLVNILSP